jgi:hypothetical protein
MEDRSDLLAACGLYCGACYHYRAGLPGGQHLLDEAARQGRLQSGYTCQGCRSGVLYLHPGCARCQLRACADGRDLDHCDQCPEFPCEQLMAFQGDGRLHHRDVVRNLAALSTSGAEAWLAGQARRWTCDCGSGFSWYEVTCANCGAPLASYGPDPRAR